VAIQHRALTGFQPLGGEDRVNEHPAGRLQHARGLLQSRLQLGNLLDDVTAPDEIEVIVREGELLHRPLDDLDPVGEPRDRNGGRRPLDVELDRIDTDTGRVVRRDESNQMRRVPAAGVEDHRVWLQVGGGDLVERVGPARIEAAVEQLVHPPRFLAVHAREPTAVFRHSLSYHACAARARSTSRRRLSRGSRATAARSATRFATVTVAATKSITPISTGKS
jgi:hypothetical protein